jgi:uncharacterized protein (DUF934 family)
MPIFSRDGVREDVWIHLDDESVPAAETPSAWTVPADRWLRQTSELAAAPGRRGIRLAPDTEVESLAGRLEGVDLVTVELPKFKDGRAFTQARLLRGRLGFRGEIRARGHVIPDQLQFLQRCGVDSVELPEDARIETWSRAMRRFQAFYQNGLSDRSAAELRHPR